VTQTPITKVVPPPPPTFYVKEIWKNPMEVVSKTKEKTCVKGRHLEGLGATKCKD
jgi:hypothetical protein